jgi:hypothetical protein
MTVFNTPAEIAAAYERPIPSCPECGDIEGVHLPRCLFDRPPVIPTLEWLKTQAADFHTREASRSIACPICHKHARYCGHTRDDMIAHLTPRAPHTPELLCSGTPGCACEGCHLGPRDTARPPAYDGEAFAAQLDEVLGEIRELLIAKNKAYGNSALEPVRAFSKANPVEQILVRIDDKISRLMRGENAGEDTVADLRGYLILLAIAEKQA